MLLDCLWLVVTNWYSTTDCLISHRFYLTLFPQRVEIKHINLFVRTIDKEKLMPSILNINLCDSETDMLGHLMYEFHLYHSPDLVTFIAENKLGNLLVTHIGWSVNFRAELPDLRDTLGLVRPNGSRFDEIKICASILEDAEAGAARSPMSCHLKVRVVLKGYHRLSEHVLGLRSTKSVKWFVTVLLALCCHDVLICFCWHGLLILILFVLFGLEADDYRVEGLHEILDGVIDASIRKRRCNHTEQIVDYHLGQVEDLSVLLVWSEQVPIKLSGKVSWAPNRRQEGLHV